MKAVKVWLAEQYYGVKTLLHSLFFRDPGLKFAQAEFKSNPIVVIPGLMQKWNLFRKLIPLLNQNGHPVYIAKDLKRNLMPVEQAALIVKKVIADNDLKDVILIGHSKGGLIGKYLMVFLNNDQRVKKLVAIAAPFHGTRLANKFPLFVHRQLIPDSELLRTLDGHSEVNQKIISIYGTFDNLVMPVESCILDKAKNNQLQISGHQKIMFDEQTYKLILGEVL